MSAKRAKAAKASSVKKYSSAFVSGVPTITSVTQNLTNDRRRVVSKKSHPKLPSPLRRRKESPPPEQSTSLETNEPFGIDGVRGVTSAQKRRRRRKAGILASDEPMRQFRAHADEYVHNIMHTEGRGDAREAPCPTCPDHARRTAEFRCLECFGGALFCQTCVLAEHRHKPFCRIQQWTRDHFEDRSLQDLGLRIKLGHLAHEECPCPKTKTDMIAIHVNGLHRCTVDFCGCAKSVDVDDWEQLLRRRLYPATTTDPHTFCTFDVLRLFHAVTLQGKVTAYDFYTALEKLTDGYGIDGWKSRYHCFLRCARQWRFLEMLKAAGRGNDVARAPTNTLPGELAVTCPACPRPGVNLPDDWAHAPKEDSFLYTLFIAMDACFRLKRRKISSWEKDPSLVDGGAYMVESAPFEKFLKGVGTQQEMSTCTDLSALDHANTKYHKGYAETGKMLGLCARHEFVQRTGVVPTQVGERYANTDYAFASLLRHHDKGLHIVLSYDICCQYSKQLAERLRGYDFPDGFRVDVDTSKIRFVIPKLHIHGHKLLCQLAFNFNWTCGCGRTDGEGVERPWAALGALGTSLRVMGPGSAYDTLDDHNNYWNSCREANFGPLARRRLIDAFAELAVQAAELKEFRAQQAEYVDDWEADVIAFEEGRGDAKNPFEPPEHGTLEKDVALELATEDEIRARDGLNCRHDMSPSDFILSLLDIENQQRALKLEVAAGHFTTTAQLTDLARQRVKMSRAIGRLREVQAIYSPASLARCIPPRLDEPAAPAEDQALHPPSALSADDRVSCLDNVAKLEARLRHGQCETALEGIRQLLLVKSRVLTYKNHNVRFQGATTRTRAILAKNGHKVDLLVHKYIDARRALVRLSGGREDQLPWPALDPGRDIRCLDDPDDTRTRGRKRTRVDEGDEGDPSNGGGHLQQCRDATGEGKRTVSWIWKGVAVDGSSEGVYQGIKVEYCKAFSRVRRWKEEVRLLQEEMRRTLVSFEAKASTWDQRRRDDTRDGPTGEGARAYAQRRANFYRKLASRFAALWSGLQGRMGITEQEAIELRAALDSEEAAIEEEDGAGAHDVGDDDDDATNSEEEVEEDMSEDEECVRSGRDFLLDGIEDL